MHESKANPPISVLMPVYNGERYVRKAINSILSQTFGDFEFIIVNDGSTDKTKSIIKSYTDHRIKYIENKNNLGIVESLNNGLEAARGEYIARMDADDISLPQRLEHQINFLKAEPDHVGVGAYIQYIDPEGWPISVYQPQLEHEIIDDYLLLGHANVIVHSVFMAKKDGMLAINGYQPHYQYAEDLDIFLRLAEIGKLANVPNVLLKVRLHDSSICVEQTDSWKDLKTKILTDAGHRRDVDINFEKMAIGKRSDVDFRLRWANQAFGNKHISTTVKNFFVSIAKNGIRKRHIEFIQFNGKNTVSWIKDKVSNK